MYFNLLLDRLPNDYKGWLIRTDFRIGIQISLCLDDKTLTETERAQTALNLLYGNGVPRDAELAAEGIRWFLRCGGPERDDLPEDNTPPNYFLDFDAGRIWASFKATYGIDLHTANMHWFEFCYLLASVGKDTSLRDAMEVRDYNTKDLKGADRAKVIRAKRALTPPVEETEEDKAFKDAFAAQMENIARVKKDG